MSDFTKGVTDYAKKLGQTLLGMGTGQDATAATQEAYRQHQLDMAQQGQPPMPYAQFAQQYVQRPPQMPRY